MELKDTVRNLLDTVRTATEVDMKHKEEDLARGNSFNLFKEMQLESDEVHMHSAFLSLLLDPQKSHGQRGKYLIPFVEMINERDTNDERLSIDTESAVVEVEKYIGPRTEERGGRIDVFIKDKYGNAVILENKIYAGDQENQIKRYWNYVQDCKTGGSIKQYKLIYLTLYGKKASDSSTRDIPDDEYLCISYKDDIIPWLRRCVELSACQPLIRETINQYIDVLRTITHSDMENTNEVLKIMSQKQNLDAVFAIASNMNAMIDDIMNDILYPQLVQIAEEKGLELLFDKYSGWMTKNYPKWLFRNRNWKYFDIAIEFESKSLGRPIIGFRKKESTLLRKNIECWDALSDRATTIAKGNQNWIYHFFDRYKDWNTPEALKAIMDGETMQRYISELMDEMIAYTQGLDV